MEEEKAVSADKGKKKERLKADGEPARDQWADNEILYEFGFSTFVLSLSTSALVHLGELARPHQQRERGQPATCKADDRHYRDAQRENEREPHEGRGEPAR